MSSRPRRVEVVVDRLVLHGVAADDVEATVTAFRDHLATLAGGGEPGHEPTAGGSHRHGPTSVGRRAASEVWRAAAPDGEGAR